MKKILVVMFASLLSSCISNVVNSDPGVCRTFEVCTYSNEVSSCYEYKDWFECDLSITSKCSWTEFGNDYSIPIDMAVSCESCLNSCGESYD